MSCYICENLEVGDTLYASSDWDGGLGFDYIRDIQYCPVCGRKLAEQTEPQTDCGDFADRLAYERGLKHAWEVAQKVFDSTITFYEAEDVAVQIADTPQTENPCDGCVCDDGKHLMYCMNCKGIAWQTEPPKVETEPSDGERRE